jgi:hypothetical protein
MTRAKAVPVRTGFQISQQALRQLERQAHVAFKIPSRAATHARSVPEPRACRRRPRCVPSVSCTTCLVFASPTCRTRQHCVLSVARAARFCFCAARDRGVVRHIQRPLRHPSRPGGHAHACQSCRHLPQRSRGGKNRRKRPSSACARDAQFPVLIGSEYESSACGRSRRPQSSTRPASGAGEWSGRYRPRPRPSRGRGRLQR